MSAKEVFQLPLVLQLHCKVSKRFILNQKSENVVDEKSKLFVFNLCIVLDYSKIFLKIENI
jgi:hypothetical protein